MKRISTKPVYQIFTGKELFHPKKHFLRFWKDGGFSGDQVKGIPLKNEGKKQSRKGNNFEEYFHEVGGFELKELIRGAAVAVLENTLGITMQSLFYQGVKPDITLDMTYYFNPADPYGLYWGLTRLRSNQ